MSNMNYEGELEVRYETGECVVVQLLGQARDLFVTLSESLLEMDTTFLGLVCKRKVVLRNSSTQKVCPFASVLVCGRMLFMCVFVFSFFPCLFVTLPAA